MTQLPLRQMTRRPILIRRDWLVISVMTVVMVAIWISVTVYAVMFQKKVTDPLRRRLEQFTPDIDEAVFEELAHLKQINLDRYSETQRVIFRVGEERQETATTSSGTVVGTPTPPIGGPTPEQ